MYGFEGDIIIMYKFYTIDYCTRQQTKRSLSRYLYVLRHFGWHAGTRTVPIFPPGKSSRNHSLKGFSVHNVISDSQYTPLPRFRPQLSDVDQSGSVAVGL